MNLPKTSVEEELFSKGVKVVLGIDEVGRGPLAGPVVAAAAWVNPAILTKEFDQRALIRDSKTLSEKQRMEACDFIINSEDFVIGIGEVSHVMVDRINILNGTLLAMKFAVEDVLAQLKAVEKVADDFEEKDMYLLVDGNREIPKTLAKQRLFTKGDARIFSIAAASVCAKVYRDELMKQYHEKWPQFGFDRHKGYGTKIHMEALKEHGPCEIHRKSFRPVKELLG